MYLNYAASCPTHPEVEQEVETTLSEFKQYLYSDAGIQWYRKKVQKCRESAAGLLQVSDPSSIAFVPNSSTANYLLLSLITWNPGDVIVSSTHENPSIRNELLALKSRGVEIQFLPPASSPSQFLTSLEHAIQKQRIKAIVLSHVSHVDGRIFPIAEIGAMVKDRNTLFIVDGAQAVGHVTVDIENLNCDAYFFSGYKWCCGPLGTGGLVITDRLISSSLSIFLKPLHKGQHPASRFEIGTHNIGLIAGFSKACYMKKEEGLNTDTIKRIRENAKQQLDKRIDVQLREWDGPHAPGILTIAHTDHHSLMTIFEKEQIVVKSFTEYPKDEIPLVRMSWLQEADANHVTETLDRMKQ